MPNFIHGYQPGTTKSIRYEVCSAGYAGLYRDACFIHLATAKGKAFGEERFQYFAPRFSNKAEYDIKGARFAVSHSCY